MTLSGAPPQVVITTNEERSLPTAFLRRGIVLQLKLPDDPATAEEMLVRRGQAGFANQTTKEVLEKAASLLVDERRRAQDRGDRSIPGQAEYFDLIRAVVRQHPEDHALQLSLLEDTSLDVLRKNPES